MGAPLRLSSGQRWAFAALVLLLLGFAPALVFNRQIFLFLNQLHSPATDLVWISFTTLGDGLILALILGCYLLVNPRVACAGLLLMLLSSVAIHLIKALYNMPRPAEVLSAVHVVGPLLRSGTFPSGHTAAAISAGLAIAFFGSSRPLGTTALIVAALISVSRVFVGAHFPADVVGAAVVALIVFILFTALIWPRIEDRIPAIPTPSKPLWRWALFVEVVAALFALSVYSLRFAENPPVAAAVSIAVLAFLSLRSRKSACRGLP